MPDISMCSGKKCKLAKTCYRKLAKPSSHQDFFINPPFQKNGTICDYYWPVEKPAKIKKDKR